MEKLRFVKGKPFFWPLVRWRLNPPNPEKLVFPFGRTIYYEGDDLDPSVAVHEWVHLKRQKFSYPWAAWWWITYLLSPSFRYQEEAAAYRKQYEFILAQAPHRATEALEQLAGDLSGAMYGKMASYHQARSDIRLGAVEYEDAEAERLARQAIGGEGDEKALYWVKRFREKGYSGEQLTWNVYCKISKYDGTPQVVR